MDVNYFAECESCFCFAARRAARAVTQRYERALRPSGLRATQFTQLVVLARAGAIPLSRAAAILGMERTTLTRNLRPLEAKGLVRVYAGPDLRVKIVAIEPAGIEALREALPLWREVQRAVKDSICPEAVEALIALGSESS